MCFKGENQRDFGLDERVKEEEEEAMGISESGIAPAVALSRYHQEQELSAMVNALSRVVAGEPEPMAHSSHLLSVASSGHSSPSAASSGGQKRGREEVLQCFGGYVAGEASSNVNISGDFMFCFCLIIHEKIFIL